MNSSASFPSLEVVPVSRPGCACCEIIGRNAFCSGLGTDDMRGLLSLRGNLRLDPGQTLFREGDPHQYVFAVVTGTVKLSKLLANGRRQIVGFLFAGDFFGMSMDASYDCTAEGVAPAVLCRFPQKRLTELMRSAPEMTARVMERLTADLTRAQEQMLLLGRMTARERLARFLLDLSSRAVGRGCAPTPVQVPMSRLDIADYLGLTIETVSRTLTALRRDGLIGLPSACAVEIVNPDALGRVAEGPPAL